MRRLADVMPEAVRKTLIANSGATMMSSIHSKKR